MRTKRSPHTQFYSDITRNNNRNSFHKSSMNLSTCQLVHIKLHYSMANTVIFFFFFLVWCVVVHKQRKFVFSVNRKRQLKGHFLGDEKVKINRTKIRNILLENMFKMEFPLKLYLISLGYDIHVNWLHFVTKNIFWNSVVCLGFSMIIFVNT